MRRWRSERYAKLPPELYAALVAYSGPTFLWEKYPPELIAANKAKGWPTYRQNPEFSPERLYQWVVQIMQEYQKQTGQDLSSHDFHKAAFTRAAEKDIHPKRAATAFDVTAETMLRYYTATEKKKTADAVLDDLATDLLPKEDKEPPESIYSHTFPTLRPGSDRGFSFPCSSSLPHFSVDCPRMVPKSVGKLWGFAYATEKVKKKGRRKSLLRRPLC